VRRGEKRQGSGQWRGGSPVQSNPIQSNLAGPRPTRQQRSCDWLEGKCARQATHATDTGNPPRGDRSRAPDPTPPRRNRGGVRRPRPRPGSAFRAGGSPPDRLAPSSPQILCKQWIDAAGLGRRNHLINHQMQMRCIILIMQNRKIKLQNLCNFHLKHMHILLSQRKK